MSFGSELKDQVSATNQFIQNGIQFLGDLREFIKERSQIEKEYAHKLESLAKKYAIRRDKKIVPLSIGESFNSQTESEIPPDSSSFIKAWGIILQEVENIAKDRISFSETLATTFIDRIKTVATRKEESRKKHMTFAQKLTSERDKTYLEKQKAKARYDECCTEAQSSQQKQERAPDERTLEKLKKQYLQDVVEMNNNKNLYVLSIRVANEHKRKYYHKDIPALLDHLQKLNENRIEDVCNIWGDYIEHELSALSNTENHLEAIRQALQEIDSRNDSQLFIKHNKKDWEDPPDFQFEPSPVWEDKEELANDENAQVFLSNKLVKAKRRLTDLCLAIDSRRKDISGMENLINAYSKNPNLGDADIVTENCLETLREATLLETMRAKYQTEVDAIIAAIGDMALDQQPHEFKSAAFTIPTTCDLCQTFIFGIARQGFMCKECGYNCHSKCEMKVSPTCTRKKGVLNRGIVPSMTFSNPTSPWSTLNSIPNNILLATSAPDSDQSSSTVADQEYIKATVIYDYKAGSSSELTVKVGDVIMVVEHDDGSGWVQASLGGKTGLVPASYIELPDVISHASNGDYVRVLYDYDAASVEELTIREGDIIEVTDRNIGEGWWEGILNGNRGQFPEAYVKEYTT